MKVEVMTVSTSKRGHKYIQVKILEGELPKIGDVLAAQPVALEASNEQK